MDFTPNDAYTQEYIIKTQIAVSVDNTIIKQLRRCRKCDYYYFYFFSWKTCPSIL